MRGELGGAFDSDGRAAGGEGEAGASVVELLSLELDTSGRSWTADEWRVKWQACSSVLFHDCAADDVGDTAPSVTVSLAPGVKIESSEKPETEPAGLQMPDG